MNSLTSTYRLSNGYGVPVIEFGTWQTPDGDIAISSVKEALAAGYRHIDAAQGYKDEENVGQAIKESDISREEIFLATRSWNANYSYELVMSLFEGSLRKLQTDYVDLLLIHWPNPVASHDNQEQANADTWRVFKELCEVGKIKAIGVNNFLPHHLDTLTKTAKTMPMVNQVSLAPGELQPDAVEYAKKHEMILEAYSPLGTSRIFDAPGMKQIAGVHDETTAQVALRWSLQRGSFPLPKSVTPGRIKGNIELFDFELTEEEVKQIDQLDGVVGKVKNPDTTQF